MSKTEKHKDKLEQNKGLLMQISIITTLLIVLLVFESKTKSAEVYPNNFTEIELDYQNQGGPDNLMPPDPNSIDSGNTEYLSDSLQIKMSDAQFPGGEEALDNYMKTKLNYPPEAVKNDIQGRVFVSFTIDEKGKIKNAKVIRSIHPLIDTEALRLIKSMPDWDPAKINGKPISNRQTLPVVFLIK